MTGELTILKETEPAFKRFCIELDISFQCVGEGIDGDRFLVEYETASDLYALGKMVGVEALHDFNRKQNKDLNN